jgi:hypothetical protein
LLKAAWFLLHRFKCHGEHATCMHYAAYIKQA